MKRPYPCSRRKCMVEGCKNRAMNSRNPRCYFHWTVFSEHLDQLVRRVQE